MTREEQEAKAREALALVESIHNAALAGKDNFHIRWAALDAQRDLTRLVDKLSLSRVKS